MNKNYSVLRDPDSGEPLTLDGEYLRSKRRRYPIANGIPRFVRNDSYAADFGLQWKAFARTQLDSHTGVSLSEERLGRCLGGRLPEVAGKLVLEAGSGAGRFTEILLRHHAIVHSFDISDAVEANRENNGSSDDLTLVQADIGRMPFAADTYDYVVCLGVLQHTPSPEVSIRRLYEKVRPGGTLVFDHYLARWRNVLPPPIGGAGVVYRKALLRLPRSRRLGAVKRIVDFWFPIHWKTRDSRAVQRLLRRISPVHFYYPDCRLQSKDAYYEWALLDTHDATTDFYKHHRSVRQIRRCLEALGAVGVSVTKGGNGIEAICRKRAHGSHAR